jgi:glycosyltransferase involved in cell wall biosynthesis
VKILYHHRSLGDGAEGVHIDSMVDAFRALGHEVTVESLARPRGGGRGDRGMMAALRQKLPQAVFEAGVLGANALEYAAAIRTLRRRRPELLYKRHALFDIGTVAAAARLGIPVVVEANVLYTSASMRRFERVAFAGLAASIERRVFRLADLVVAVSTPLRRQIEQAGGPNVRVVVLPNGADPDLFDPGRWDGAAVRAKYGLTGQFVVGWVGVLRRWHGLEVLVRAVRDVGAALLVIGDGPERSEIERFVNSLGMSARVRITGRLAHDEIPQHIAAFDVAVSADDRTGFASPMKVVEYMAMGRAVVVPRLENFLDLVREGVSGDVFTPGDAADLARRLAALREAPDRRRELGAAARQEVINRLNWKENARQVIAAVRLGAAPEAPPGSRSNGLLSAS